jgi:2-dehydro-3-deoxyphosphogluconate aldolase / (4S)-4-hydroxy-2-oxoglutarate aldolase
MKRNTTHETLLQQGLLPVLRSEDERQAELTARALFEGGLKALEVTMTMPDPFGLIQSLARDSALLVGAGTIMSAEEGRRAIGAGARFVVSPVFDTEVCHLCLANDIAYYPGAITPNEISKALRSGATMVKVFPISNFGGPSYLKALRGPWPGFECMVSGGVDLQNMQDYVRAGARLIGLGSSLVKPELIKAEAWKDLSALANSYLESYRAALAPKEARVWT